MNEPQVNGSDSGGRPSVNSIAILTLGDDEESRLRLLADPAFYQIEAHPQTGAYARSYYPAVHLDDHRDLSFAVKIGESIVLVVLCTLIGKTIGLHGLPARFFSRGGVSDGVSHAAVGAAFAHLDVLADRNGAEVVLVRERAGSALSAIGEMALRRDASASLNLVGRVDLTLDPDDWRRRLRKSFRSLVNWGRQNLKVLYVNAQDCDRDRFMRFRLFHAEVAGRVTRSIESWDVMYAWLRQGRGELVYCEFGGKLVAGALFVDGTETSIYMTGVYDRALQKPLAHFPVWHGMERARQRGMTNLELGDIPLRDAADEKNYNIGYFKRGFVTDVDNYIVWRWCPAKETSP